jgi:hypothetical protein
MSHSHSHDHPHEHPKAPTVDEITDFEILEIAVRELAIEHGLFTAEEHRHFTEWAESIGPAGGSRLVAKAWTDPAFKARVLENATEACKEIGIDWSEPTGFGTPSDYTHLYVLEDTPKLHHVIVCTLCSCYPRPLLGMSPEWYRTTNYRRRGLQPEVPLHGPSASSGGHRELDRRAARRDRHPRHHDRRCPAQT